MRRSVGHLLGPLCAACFWRPPRRPGSATSSTLLSAQPSPATTSPAASARPTASRRCRAMSSSTTTSSMPAPGRRTSISASPTPRSTLAVGIRPNHRQCRLRPRLCPLLLCRRHLARLTARSMASPNIYATDSLTVGGDVYFAPDYSQGGASAAFLEGTADYALPANFGVSGGVGLPGLCRFARPSRLLDLERRRLLDVEGHRHGRPTLHRQQPVERRVRRS